MEVILDTNFVLSCLEKRIDFIGALESEGFKVAVPREVLDEIKDLKTNNKLSMRKRQMVGVALDLLEAKKIKKLSFGGRKVDVGLIEKGKQGVYIATLDNGIKRQVPNRITIDSSRKGIGIERD